MSVESQQKTPGGDIPEKKQPESNDSAAAAAPVALLPEDASPELKSLEKAVRKMEKTVRKKKKDKNKNAAGTATPKAAGTNRAIETMFRVTYQNHIELTALADNKANTLININGIIISVVIALVSPRIATHAWMMFPALIMVTGCMASLGYAIMASRPRIIATKITKEMVINNQAAVLFFGNFVQMEQAEFEDTMSEMLAQRGLVYNNMVRNLYTMGKVLERKYMLLRYSYTVFFLTLGMAVVFFAGMFIGMGSQ